MSGVTAIFGLAIIVGTVCVLFELNRKSETKGVSTQSPDQPTGYDEPGNNLSDPMNVRGVYDSHNAKVSQDIGPFGIKRTMRSAGNGNFLYATFGRILSEY